MLGDAESTTVSVFSFRGILCSELVSLVSLTEESTKDFFVEMLGSD